MAIDVMVIKKWCTAYRKTWKRILAATLTASKYISHVSDILQEKQIILMLSKFKIFITFKIVDRAQVLNYLIQRYKYPDNPNVRKYPTTQDFPNLRHLQKSLLTEMKLNSPVHEV